MHGLVRRAGEAAEFNTRLPHWFDRAGKDAVELLSLFGPQGERIHVRARPANSRWSSSNPSAVGLTRA